MKNYVLVAMTMCVASVVFSQQASQSKPPSPGDQYKLGLDSIPQPGVPEGKVKEFLLKDSRTYPGFAHRWWLYIPAEYDGHKRIALMVFLDGTRFAAEDGTWGRVPVVLNNLIAKKEIPVMAAVFIDPGQTNTDIDYQKAADGSPLIGKVPSNGAVPKFDNRGVEYESLDKRNADFLVDEIFPLVNAQVKVTADPNGHAIGGVSSGANAAVTAAWERPDQFLKVFASIGSFPLVLRGEEGLPQRMRRGKKQPIRMFLQDGANDSSAPEWGHGANRQKDLVALLRERGYDYKYVFGEGTHNPAHEASILPDALRWLWRDYPR
jgi:enterochelin esterase-like enzyme